VPKAHKKRYFNVLAPDFHVRLVKFITGLWHRQPKAKTVHFVAILAHFSLVQSKNPAIVSADLRHWRCIFTLRFNL
jgi:predicted SnoaL-like aldol condensation-catalyzing enzyme